MGKISVIINTFNEAHLLEDCIKSLEGFANEIIVGDMMSTDGSAELAKKMGCRVILHKWMPAVEYTTIPMVKAALFEWILLFDPDMRISKKTAERLKNIAKNDEADVVIFYMKNKIFGKYIYHGHASACHYIKFFKKSSFFKNGDPKVKIHSMLHEAVLNKTNRILKLNKKYMIEHLAYENVFKCFEQHLRYAQIEAQERFSRGIRFNFFIMILEVVRKFLTDFVYRSAWLSGMRGIIYSFIAELMVLQIHFLLWEKTKKNGN